MSPNLILFTFTVFAEMFFRRSMHLRRGGWEEGTNVGTVRYMSPERLRGVDYQKASDIWALGFAVIELATGHYPLPVKGIVHDRIEPKRDPRVRQILALIESVARSMASFALLSPLHILL